MSTEVEVKAKEMGWSPKEEFRGDPDKWISAEDFVSRGETLMPILKANNRKLTEKLDATTNQVKELKNLLIASQESIEALKEFNTKATKREAKEVQEVLVERITEARKENDVATELELTEELQKSKAALEKAEKEPEKKTPVAKASSELSPEFRAWADGTGWYGKDMRKTALANQIAHELAGQPEMKGISGRPFLDRVQEEVENYLNEKTGKSTGKVAEGSRNGAGSGGGGNGASKKTFADLDADAKQACERQAARLVGKGRAFANMDAWKAHYVKTYFEE